jgi:hypothetical protein
VHGALRATHHADGITTCRTRAFFPFRCHSLSRDINRHETLHQQMSDCSGTRRRNKVLSRITYSQSLAPLVRRLQGEV